MRVFVAGATGAIGRELVPLLVQGGHEVFGLTRSAERGRSVEAAGGTAVVADALHRDAVVAAVRDARPDAVIDELTAIPDAWDPRKVDRDFELTNRLRTEGTRNLIEGMSAAGAGHFLAQSVAFAYDPAGEGLRDEDAPFMREPPKAFANTLRSLQEHERLTLDAGGTVLRYGQFYGLGTSIWAGGSFADRARKRQLPIVGGGDGQFSFISCADAARGTVLALERDYRGVLNVVEDAPALAREWIPVFAAAVGAPKPWRLPRFIGRLGGGEMTVYSMTVMPGASNARAKEALGFRPGSWRERFLAIRA
jgi:nucleoside-diphosphate-sugar epimerase